MKYTNFIKEKKKWRTFGVMLCMISMIIVPLTSSVADNTIYQQDDKVYNGLTSLTYNFGFLEPEVHSTEINDAFYTAIEMNGCLAMGKHSGAPMMPVKSVQLLLPPLKTVSQVMVSGDPVEVELGTTNLQEKPVVPHQNYVPIGHTEQPDFKIDDEIYSSNAVYPTTISEEYSIGYSHGYTILSLSLNPTQYQPSEGKLLYYPELTITIDLQDTEDINEFFRNTPDDKQWVESLVSNPEISECYESYNPTSYYPGGLCSPSEDYDYVIITTTYNDLDYWSTGGTISYNWEDLMDKHEDDDGLSCILVTIQDIDACTDYHSSTPLFNDQEAHIREFCKDAYEDWETEYILIGGDDEWIPARHMDTGYEYNIDSDIYWSNLDSTFNEDQDNYWGESGDAGFDLYSEIFIGRLTCDEPQDVSNWMTKSFYYADSTDYEYLDNAAFYGGDTGWSCQGDDFEDFSAIKGTDDWLGPQPHYDGPWPTWLGFLYGFETWNTVNPGNVYDLSVKWTAEPPNPGWEGGSEYAAINGLKNDINNDQVTLISGIAHANSEMSLDVYSSDWESDYHNTKPFFIHDFGCHCGDMDDSNDGVLHSMLFHSDTELAFGCVYNTCYGWGNLYCTNSSSALQQKLFWDYLFDTDNNSGDFGNWQLGKAHAWSKDVMAPTIDWDPYDGTWRAIIQGCLLFADPAQKLKTPTPSDPPQTPSKPNGPDHGIIHYDIMFTTGTTDPNFDKILYMFDWGDGSNSGWLGPYNSGETITAIYAWSTLGDFEVRVRAKDVLGAGTVWSEPLAISIVDNIPPNLPLIQGPTSGSPGSTYLYRFSSIDEDGHDVFFYVDWGDDTVTEWEGPYHSGDEAGLTHTWSEKGSYIIRVKAMDELGDESDWSTLEIAMPVTQQKIQFPLLQSILQRFPHAFPLLREVLGC